MNRNLIVLRCGRSSLHEAWLGDKTTRTWDLLLCPFEEIQFKKQAGVAESGVLVGQKWAGLAALFHSDEFGENYYSKYDYIWLPDDDILTDQSTINDFFLQMPQRNAMLAAPSLDTASHFSHLITLQNSNFKARKTNFVEIMMPCFEISAFKRCVTTFALSKTGFGWGLDAAWPVILGGEGIFIFDSISVLHTRPINNSRNPDLLKKVNQEWGEILRMFGAEVSFRNLAGYLPNGAELARTDNGFFGLLVWGWEAILRDRPAIFDRLLFDAGYKLD